MICFELLMFIRSDKFALEACAVDGQVLEVAKLIGWTLTSFVCQLACILPSN